MDLLYIENVPLIRESFKFTKKEPRTIVFLNKLSLIQDPTGRMNE